MRSRTRCSPDCVQEGKDTLSFFFNFGSRFLDRWCSSSLVLFFSAIYSCQGDLATCVTCLYQSEASQKCPRRAANRGLRTCMQPDRSCSTRQPASPACRSTQTTGLVTSIVVLRFGRTPLPLCHSWKELFSFCSWNGGEIARELFAILPAASAASSRRSTKHTSVPAVKAAVRCLLLTANAADNKHHPLAKSRSMFETSTQKSDRRHPTPFPNTNEVECMPCSYKSAWSTTVDSMHNTLSVISQLQMVAGRACDVIYSLIRVSSSCLTCIAGDEFDFQATYEGNSYLTAVSKQAKTAFLLGPMVWKSPIVGIEPATFRSESAARFTCTTWLAQWSKKDSREKQTWTEDDCCVKHHSKSLFEAPHEKRTAEHQWQQFWNKRGQSSVIWYQAYLLCDKAYFVSKDFLVSASLRLTRQLENLSSTNLKVIIWLIFFLGL